MAHKRGRETGREKSVYFTKTLSFLMSYFIFSTLSAFFFLIPFFAACFLMPVVFAAYETDVIEHSWSGKETMREERFSCCFAACTLS